jgi:hypothetical protein
MMTNPEYYFEGAPFESPELDAALVYLQSIGLIQGMKVWDGAIVTPRLTASGIECAERSRGSVVDHQDRQRGGGTTNNLQFHGAISGGNFAIGNHDVTQSSGGGIRSQFRMGRRVWFGDRAAASTIVRCLRM